MNDAMNRALKEIEEALHTEDYSAGPVVANINVPTPRLIEAIRQWQTTRTSLAMAEHAFHLAQMELIYAEDEERKHHALKEHHRGLNGPS
jgi:hypothetical protein